MLGYSHDVPGGAAWSLRLRAGRTATFTALGDSTTVTTLIFGGDLLDRMNIPDTLKAQMSARIVPPMTLMSDRGLALASVTDSSVEWHDCLCGFTGPADLDRFAPTDYQRDRNGWQRSARDVLLLELFKHGLGEDDLHGSVNFFAKVVPDETDPRCALTFVPGAARRGDTVTLRAEQDLLVVLATTPHPLDPSPVYAPDGVSVTIGVADPVAEDDPTMLFRAESARALLETRKVLL